MALKETITIQTVNNPKVINELHERYAVFFWNVLHVQITHDMDSHLEFRDAGFGNIEIRNAKSNVEFATITYERDKLIPYYDAIKATEAKYDKMERILRMEKGLMNSIRRGFPIFLSILMYFVFGILIGFAFVSVLGEDQFMLNKEKYYPIVYILAGVATAIFGFGKMIICNMRYRKYRNTIEEEILPEMEAIMEKAMRLNRKIIREMRDGR